ncbi:hypothetical protein BBJ28_00017443 [Nothophytophthora sp. Chile5]|nr:hypothetical protein BBJ28_00017443 [Nothophytophthora sp. Chile5]
MGALLREAGGPDRAADAAVAVAVVSERHGGEEQQGDGDDVVMTRQEFFRRYPHLREFACGGTAAAINILVTFPPNKVMFRQQVRCLFGLNTWQALENVRSEGWLMLYRGVKPPLLQAMVSKSIMFGLYNFYDGAITNHFGRHPGLHLVAAGLAGTTEAILAPFERAQTLLQTPKFNREITGAYDAMVHINKYGLREHYRGLSAILCRNGPGNILFFGFRGPLRDLFPRGNSTAATMANDFICGAMLGAIISTISFPINGTSTRLITIRVYLAYAFLTCCCLPLDPVARTRMQSVYGQRFLGPWEALRLTYEERGHSVRRLYRGVHMNFFRSLLSWGIINSTYEKLKSIT